MASYIWWFWPGVFSTRSFDTAFDIGHFVLRANVTSHNDALYILMELGLSAAMFLSILEASAATEPTQVTAGECHLARSPLLPRRPIAARTPVARLWSREAPCDSIECKAQSSVLGVHEQAAESKNRRMRRILSDVKRIEKLKKKRQARELAPNPWGMGLSSGVLKSEAFKLGATGVEIFEVHPVAQV